MLLYTVKINQDKDMHHRDKQCPELTDQTAAVIDDPSLRRLFISVQRNNINLCIRAAIEYG
jgi:hypothetical protein